MKINHFICPNCGHDFYADSNHATCDACQYFFYVAQSKTCSLKMKDFNFDFVGVQHESVSKH
jgi:hypothetical protein